MIFETLSVRPSAKSVGLLDVGPVNLMSDRPIDFSSYKCKFSTRLRVHVEKYVMIIKDGV